jgi:RimJ/RimL family protein N-acetyltransferase
VVLRDLTTERLLLRSFTPADEAIHALVFGDPEVAVPFAGRTRTLAEVRDWLVCRRVQYGLDEFGCWAVERRADGVLLGVATLQSYVADWIVFPGDDERRNRIEVEYGYALGRQHWGHGYATEAGHAVIGYAFGELRLSRLAFSVDAANVRSQAVLRRLGFREVQNLHPDAASGWLGVLDNELA